MKGAEITIKDLVKVYRLGNVEVQALRGLSMTIKESEVVSIIGPSGSGKTSLLNIVGGLDHPTAGSVIVNNQEITGLSQSQLVDYRRMTVGHIFQSLSLIPTLTAAENVELPMIACRKKSDQRKKRVLELLEEVGLANRAKHKPDELSGGEQQRVAIAAALANDAPIILADEPTGELDTTNVKIVVDYLVKISRDLGKTVVLVTHDPNVARRADRILRIVDGTISAGLTPAQISEPTAAISYVDQLKSRLSDINMQLEHLDEEFSKRKISGDQYVEQRLKFKQTKEGLLDELHRMGVVI